MPSTAPITGGRVLVSRTGESTTGSRSRWTWGRWVRLEALQDVVGGWVVISCCCLVAKSCLTVCDPMDHSTLDFPDLHHLLEFAQTHVHWVTDAIQPSHPLSPSSPPCPHSFPASGSFPMNWHLASGGQSIGASASVSVLPMNIQGWFPLGLTGFTSLLSKWLSRVFSSITVWKHQFFSAQPSLWSKIHIYSWLLEKS